MKKKSDAAPAGYEGLAELSARVIQAGKRINRDREKAGLISVLDEAQEAHAAFRAVAGLAECVQDESGIPGLKGGDLAALLRVVNARLGRAIDVAFAASTGESGAVVSIRD